MFKFLFEKFKLPESDICSLDDAETTLRRRDIIIKKKFLKKLYIKWYNVILKKISGLSEGKLLEIGSGGGFIKELNPGIITSDILPLDHCDLVLSAEYLPFQNNELSAIIMIDVLHHIPDCLAFFKEAQRTLKNGGKIIMIEPANTLWSRFIYKNLHHESFDPKTKSWTFPSSGPLSGANIALPWIIFERDIDEFMIRFPNLQLVNIHYHTPFRYLLSGGVSYRSFVPSRSFGTITFIEKLISPLSKFLAMFQTIEVIKR
ncbi:MAG: methyltransferase domain-containing protein [Bacteroidota bacterium]